MNEKRMSTDDLAMGMWHIWGCEKEGHEKEDVATINSIIDRLKSADRLCNMAKLLSYIETQGSYIPDMVIKCLEYLHIAIADYER